MTEQEKRIEEMANTILPCAHKSCVQCLVIGCKCKDYKACEKLYDAGYRKADEVRKEAAKEILTIITSGLYSVGDGIYKLTEHDVQELMRWFGVEVEE